MAGRALALLLAAVAACVVLLSGAAADAAPDSIPARPRYLDDFSVDEVTAWLAEQRLDRAFGAAFAELQYDGDVLAHFLKPGELALADFPGATLAHAAKLFDRIQKFARPAPPPAAEPAHDGAATADVRSTGPARRLASSNGNEKSASASGIRILHNESTITMGTTGDVSLRRGGPDRLSTEDDLYVQGVDVLRLAAGLSGGGVAWNFTHPASRHFLRSAPDLVLPPHFTIELWVYPLSDDSNKFFLSFAVETNFNCLLLRMSGFAGALHEWHHVVVTYDRHSMSVHDNGELNMKLVAASFCTKYTGSLVVGQEQDSVGGRFNWVQGAPMMLDTVAIYSRTFDEAERATTGKACVDMTDPDLVTLWTGYTRGADQVGINQAEVNFESFAPGAVSTGGSCSNEGEGEGTLGEASEDYSVSHFTPAVGAVGWVFPGADTTHHFMVPDFQLPLDFTVEAWVFPLNATTNTYFMSFATEDNNNCFVLRSWFWEEPRVWYHVVVTWDGLSALVYIDGVLSESIRHGEFCDQYRGSLSFGQEQDAVAGNFDINQAPAMILDTVAVYSRAWSTEKVQEEEQSPCVNVGAADLYALYTGYSRGKDLVGGQDGTVVASEIVSPGQTLAESYRYWTGDVEFDVDACAAAQAAAGAVAPAYDSSVVGGVGWDFSGDTTAHYLLTEPDFELPPEFTIEMWMYPRRKQGYVLSFASEDNQNCLLLQNGGLWALNQWHHIVVTVAKEGTDRFDYKTTVYVNGTAKSGILYGSGFCGNHTGSLAIAQEQDAVGGAFDITQATDAVIDTLAVYSTAWGAARVGKDRAVGVDLQEADLYALYSGFTRGKDLVGHQDATVWLEQFADGMPNTDANINTLDMLSPATVGGVAWDFPAGSTDYYLQSGNMTLPNGGFTIEMWVSLNSLDTTGYFLSYCVADNCNCLITTMAGFSSANVGKWSHFVLTYDAVAGETYTYLDGVNNQDFLHVEFCGDPGPGTLSVATEQDTMGGGYAVDDTADILIDTVAIYDSYWDEAQISAREGVCVNLHDPSLFTVWSGYTRGKDLVGHNDASTNIFDWAEGAELACEDYAR